MSTSATASEPIASVAAVQAPIPYDDAPFRPFHLRVAIAGAGSEFSDAFGLGIIGIALSRASSELSLTPVWMGLLAAASLAGLFAGALLTGPVADRFGRRPVFAFNMIVLGVLSLLQAFVHSSVELLMLRVAIGFVLGTDYAVNKAVLIEILPRKSRARLLGSLAIFWAAGYSSAYFVGFALDGTSSEAWRWMLLSSAIPCIVVLPFRLATPETPLWLMNQGRVDAAARVVRKTMGEGIDLPPRAISQSPTEGRWGRLFSTVWRGRTVLSCAFFTCMVIPYFAVGTFIAEVMSAIDLQSAYVGGLIYNFALLGGAFGGVAVVDRLSRRAFLIGCFAISAVSMLALSVWSNIPPAAMILLFAVFAGVLSASSILVYVYLPELFPTDLRATGIGLASAVSRIGSAISTFLLPVVVATAGIQVALGACVVVLSIGALICQKWAPETRNLHIGALDQAPAQ